MPSDIVGTGGYNNGPYQLPDRVIDKGSEVFDVLEDFMERMAVHNHSGDDSAALTNPTRKDVSTFTSGVNLTWQGLDIDGNVTGVSADIVRYRAQLTCHPQANSYDDNVRFHFVRGNGGEWEKWNPSVEKIDATTYFVFSNEQLNEVKVTAI